MNLLGRIFGSKTQTIEDAVFGRIDLAHGVWTHIPKEEKDFMIVVVAPESGPLESQRAFFKKLSSSLVESVESAKRFVQASSGSVDIASLSLYSVEIGPDEEIAQNAFTIELTSPEQSPIHRVEFIGGKPSVYGCDERLFQLLIGVTAFFHVLVLVTFKKRPTRWDAWTLTGSVVVALVPFVR